MTETLERFALPDQKARQELINAMRRAILPDEGLALAGQPTFAEACKLADVAERYLYRAIGNDAEQAAIADLTGGAEGLITLQREVAGFYTDPTRFAERVRFMEDMERRAYFVGTGWCLMLEWNRGYPTGGRGCPFRFETGGRP